MLQIVQHQKTGELTVVELPAPMCLENGILVKTHYSLISAGTEKTSVEKAKASLLERARKQPEDMKLVMDFLKRDGISSTLKRVKNKLNSYKTLGYSLSGEVIESKCDEFKVGDLVACGGANLALHSEIITVPKNLAVKIPQNVSLEDAAYTTLGSIAMQGVRQADVRLGENVAVIGLGLLGQITVQLLVVSGINVVGIDINKELLEKAKEFGCSRVFPSSKESVAGLMNFTNHIGFDAVIIAAGTSSNQPMELAIQIARKKAKVVVVGAVGMNIQRNPFYEKELDITISCSYGPGRYDPLYEEKGIDYPVGYVRWTENRNMQAFLDLISGGKIFPSKLTTHRYKLEDAADAYKLITAKEKQFFLGILLDYPKKNVELKRTFELHSPKALSKINIGFIGAGSFAQSYLLPHLNMKDVSLSAVSNANPSNSLTVAKNFGFHSYSSDGTEVINRQDVNCVFIATRHDTHYKFVMDAIKAGKPVFVEKPLAINLEQLDDIKFTLEKHNGRVMVGFNRRFSKPFLAMKEFFSQRTQPLAITYRVNAGFIPNTVWVCQPEQGGRIIGEVCHFIDCMVYLTNAIPVKVYAQSVSSNNTKALNQDNVSIQIKFSDGSIGTVHYFSNGDSSYPKEYCECFAEQSIAIMNNFTSLELTRGGKTKKMNFDGKKGHKEEVEATINAIKQGKEMPIPFSDIYSITKATFLAVDNC